MRWLNLGIGTLFDVIISAGSGAGAYEGGIQECPYTDTGYAYRLGSAGGNGSVTFVKKAFSAMQECWLSFNYALNHKMSGTPQMHVIFFGTKYNIYVYASADTQYRVRIGKATCTKNTRGFADDSSGNIINWDKVPLLYMSDSSLSMGGLARNQTSNLEIHLCMGEKGRIDVWDNTKLHCSYRSPSDFMDNEIVGIGFNSGFGAYASGMEISSIICQDTRRIGLERFKMLTVDPSGEQVMPQGSTTTFTLSGLSDSTEFSDITSIGVMLQATSRDANITEGTFALGGAEIGKIDVSDSSGRAFEIVNKEINERTNAPWTRDEIEGKQLTFTVNGAS